MVRNFLTIELSFCEYECSPNRDQLQFRNKPFHGRVYGVGKVFPEQVATSEIDISLGKAKMVMWSWQNNSSETRAKWASLQLTGTPLLPSTDWSP